MFKLQEINEGQTSRPANLGYFPVSSEMDMPWQIIIKEEVRGKVTLGVKWIWKSYWYGWWIYLWPV